MNRFLKGPNFIMIQDIDGSVNFHTLDNQFHLINDGDDQSIRVHLKDNTFTSYCITTHEYNRLVDLLIDLSIAVICVNQEKE